MDQFTQLVATIDDAMYATVLVFLLLICCRTTLILIQQTTHKLIQINAQTKYDKLSINFFDTAIFCFSKKTFHFLHCVHHQLQSILIVFV